MWKQENLTVDVGIKFEQLLNNILYIYLSIDKDTISQEWEASRKGKCKI